MTGGYWLCELGLYSGGMMGFCGQQFAAEAGTRDDSAGFQNTFEHRQIFLELSFHLFFQHALTQPHQVNGVSLQGQRDLRAAFDERQGIGGEGLQWSGDGLEPVFPVGFVVGDFKCALDALFQPMAGALKISAQLNSALSHPGGGQGAVLPLKIIFGCANEIEDILDGPVDQCVAGDFNHSCTPCMEQIIQLTGLIRKAARGIDP